MIATCASCVPHAFQDQKYGLKKRVFNSCKGGAAMRCTVCGTERNASGDSVGTKKK